MVREFPAVQFERYCDDVVVHCRSEFQARRVRNAIAARLAQVGLDVLRAGNAGSNTVVDHIAVLRAALAQLPGGRRSGKNVLARIDGAGGTHELLAWLTRRRLT